MHDMTCVKICDIQKLSASRSGYLDVRQPSTDLTAYDGQY